MPYVEIRETESAVIAQDGNLSGVVDLVGRVLVAIQMPNAWTAANLTFQGGMTAAALNNVYNQNGVEVTVTADKDRYITIDPADLASVRYIKVRSGTAAVPVAQAAARTLTLVVRPV